MIGVSPRCRAIIDDGNMIVHCAVSSWLGDELLAQNIPVTSGFDDTDRSLAVPEMITLEVPALDRGVRWTPTSDTHPLAAAGQILKIACGIALPSGIIEWFQRGEYVITQTTPAGGTVRVQAAGRLWLVSEAGFVQPFQPSGTIAGTLRALVEPALTVDLADAPADRAVPAGINFADRLGAVNELLDAWPAVAVVNRQGNLEVRADEVPTAGVRHFHNRVGGTIVEAAGSSTRDGGFNVVVATGQAADGGEIRGAAYRTTGPWAYAVGPANPLPVPFGYASPLLTTIDQCIAAAHTVLRRKTRESLARRYTIDAVPDPTLQQGDPITITTDDVTDLLCTVERIRLPYLPDRMTLTVAAAS